MENLWGLRIDAKKKEENNRQCTSKSRNLPIQVQPGFEQFASMLNISRLNALSGKSCKK